MIELLVVIIIIGILAAISKGANLGHVTGSYCSACACTAVMVAPNVSDPAFAATACGVSFDNLVNKLAAASDEDPAVMRKLMTDAWGHPMTIDENEGENGTWCTIQDSLRTMWQSPNLSFAIPLSGLC